MWKYKLRPRFGDLDPLRHVNNCMLPIWFEGAQEPFYRHFNPDLDVSGPWPLIKAKITVDYVSQMGLDDIEIHSFVKKIGRSSITFYQEAWQKRKLGAKGETVFVHYDYELQKSVAIPEEIRKALEPHMVDPENPNLKTRSGRFSGL